MTKPKGTACKNCKHVEVSHYWKGNGNQLPDALVGTCKVAFCPCAGFAPSFSNVSFLPDALKQYRSASPELQAIITSCKNELLLCKAIVFAVEVHDGQKRDGGQDYIIHPAQTAKIVSQVTDDPEIIAAAWLHDTIEDTDTTYADLLQQFGKRVADLVNEVTHEREQRPYGQAYFPRLKTRDGIMLKLADRLSNISDMNAWPEQRRQAYLRKTQFWASEPRPWEPK